MGSPGFRTFLLVALGQAVSLTGSGLTGFALGVWVYQRTGSVTQFALISLFTALPGIIFSPIAGALVDRWDRRFAMIFADVGAGFCTVTIALLLYAGRLEVWHIYVAMGASSSFSAFQWPAYSAATSSLVPKSQLGRAGGIVQMGEAFAQILSPPLAGALLGLIAIEGIIVVDFLTFLFAVLTLLLVRIPRPPVSAEGAQGRGSLLREATYGMAYIRARPGLLGLLLLFVSTNFITGIVEVLFTPLVLSFTSPAVLGLIMSVGGVGFLAGSLVMSVWGGPRVRMKGLYAFLLVQGIVLLAAGIPPNVTIVAAASFLFFFGVPIVNSCSQAIWQTKTALDVQGRVFSVRRMIAWSSLPLAYLAAGPLADRVFEPLLAEGGALAGSVGQVIGVGEGRGIGFLFIAAGVANLCTTLIALAHPRLRNLEAELPDAAAAGAGQSSATTS